MSVETKAVSNIDSPRRSRPTKLLPTDRISISRQLDLLRAFGAAGEAGKPVLAKDAAKIVQMSESTPSLAVPFFVDVGLLSRGADGFVPSAEVLSYKRSHAWAPDTAAHKLAPLLRSAWFASILTRLEFGPLEESAAIKDLADAVAAGPEYRKNLEMLIEYLTASGLVEKDGSVLRPGRAKDMTAQPAEESAPANGRPPAPSRSAVATGFVQAPTEGTVRFHGTVAVDMAEFGSWRPERIAAFFAGMAQVLAAKADIERQNGE